MIIDLRSATHGETFHSLPQLLSSWLMSTTHLISESGTFSRSRVTTHLLKITKCTNSSFSINSCAVAVVDCRLVDLANRVLANSGSGICVCVVEQRSIERTPPLPVSHPWLRSSLVRLPGLSSHHELVFLISPLHFALNIYKFKNFSLCSIDQQGLAYVGDLAMQINVPVIHYGPIVLRICARSGKERPFLNIAPGYMQAASFRPRGCRSTSSHKGNQLTKSAHQLGNDSIAV